MTKGVRDEAVKTRNPRSRPHHLRLKALSLAALSALGTMTITFSSGCRYDPPPFDPREIAREESRRAAQVNRTPITTQPLGDPGNVPRGQPQIPTVDPI